MNLEKNSVDKMMVQSCLIERFEINFRSLLSSSKKTDKNLVVVGNKTKGANLKTEVTRKQSTPSFPKNEHLSPDTHTYVCVLEGKKCSFFGKLGVLCFLVISF